MKHLYPPFHHHVTESGLIERGDTIIAAFSGGKDSLTLLHLLIRLREDIPFDLTAAYFNHRLRRDAAAEEHFVRTACRELNVPLVCGGDDVLNFKQSRRINLENAASILRYRFLKSVADRHHRAKIATAHTRSDLSETFLIKLLRGSGTQGLGAIFPMKGPHIIRPLLYLGNSQILAFLERNHLEYYSDPTNRDRRFLRNQLRSGPIRDLMKLEPRLEEHLGTTAVILRDEYQFLAREAETWLTRNLLLGKILPVPILLDKSPAMQRHILREYLRILRGDLLDIGFLHIEYIRENCSSHGGVSLPGLALKFHPGFVYPAGLTISSYSYSIGKPGRLHIPEAGGSLVLHETDRFKPPDDHHEIFVPRTRIGFPLTVRNPRRTDAYKKLNSAFSQRVFEMVRVSGTPPELRNLHPLVEDSRGGIVWVAGAPPAHPYRIRSRDRGPFINVRFSRNSGQN